MARIFKTYNKPEASKVRKMLVSFFLSYVGLFIIVLIYCIVGAVILIRLEEEEEAARIAIKKEAHKKLEADKQYIVDNSWYLRHTVNESEFLHKIGQNLNLFKKNIVKSNKKEYYDGKPDEWTYDWTFSNSLLFTVTTVGSIGYGNISPTNWISQFFIIYYGMCGIPLLLLFLSNIGEVMAKALKYIYSRCCCRWCRVKRKFMENKKKMKTGIIRKEEVGSEYYMPTEKVDVPIMVNLLVLALYLIFGGVIFSYSENWQVYEASYFAYITLITIGFGDYVAGRVIDNNVALTNFVFVVNICYCIFGMALLSMAINLMQEQIVGKTKWFAQETGIIDEVYDPVQRYKIRYADEDDMLITPDDYTPFTNTDKENLLHNAHLDGDEYDDGASRISEDRYYYRR